MESVAFVVPPPPLYRMAFLILFFGRILVTLSCDWPRAVYIQGGSNPLKCYLFFECEIFTHFLSFHFSQFFLLMYIISVSNGARHSE